MKTLLTIPIVLWSFFSYAQFNENTSGRYAGQFEITLYDAPIEGSPYLDEMYKTGKATIAGASQASMLMRYNAYADEMEFLDSTGKPRKLMKNTNVVVDLDGTIYEVHEYEHRGKMKEGYFIALNEGPIILYKKPGKQFRQAEQLQNSYEEVTPAKYSDNTTYYLWEDGKDMQQIRLNRKDFIYHLDDNTRSLKKFLQRQKLKLKTEEEAVKVLTYYNKMQQLKGTNENAQA